MTLRAPAPRPVPFPLVLLASLLFGACAATPPDESAHESAAPPLAGATPVDHLIQPGETHFAHLWQVTRGGNNAEGYWSFAGDRLTLQRTADGAKCDRIFVTDPSGGDLLPVSSGRGTTTCSYFLPGDREVLYASTHEHHADCPPPPDRSRGYVWPIHPEFAIHARDLATGAERKLIDAEGYDAEATVSPRGDRIVFTSERSGDLELWTCAVDGGDLKQVTDELGYDGGAFFSHDGKKLVFRATRFTDDEMGSRQTYTELRDRHTVRPHQLDIYVCDADGANRRRVTDLGGASWAPYFFPGDRRILFATNHHDTSERKTEFDLFAVDLDGSKLERITTYQGFDSFPMFSPDGRYLVFASNRGGTEQGETNLFVARWK